MERKESKERNRERKILMIKRKRKKRNERKKENKRKKEKENARMKLINTFPMTLTILTSLIMKKSQKYSKKNKLQIVFQQIWLQHATNYL